MRIHLDEPVGRINPNLHGLFTEHLGDCIYGGLWVGEGSGIPNAGGIRQDVAEALRKVRPGIVRWPGGCFADDYAWEDGVGPREKRPRRVNLWWGQAIETNEFGTHEFVQFCRLIGAEPLIVGNMGSSGSPREMERWVEYCNFPGDSTLARRRAGNGSPEPLRVRYWGIGNEAWGCGGVMDPEDYAVEFKRFSTYLHDMGGTRLYIIASGPDGNDLEWTRRFFAKHAGHPRMNAYSAHYYHHGRVGDLLTFSPGEWYHALQSSQALEGLIVEQRGLMDSFDPERHTDLVLDEWGSWHPIRLGNEPAAAHQQNTLRDALLAASTLDVLHRQADKVAMANIAQAVNVLQALVLTEGDRLLLTPTYHVFGMYGAHVDGQSLRVSVEADEITYELARAWHKLAGLSGSASLRGKTLTVSVVNPSVDSPMEARLELEDGQAASARAVELTHQDIHARNTLAQPDVLVPRPTAIDWRGSVVQHTFPPASVTVITAELG
jgi:alpha-L-arabinofuranosidase